MTNSGNDSVSVIDGKTNTVIKNIIVGENPTGVAVNQATNFIYVSKFSSPTIQ
ncbi:MAG: YncE family protein [Nitrosotalea sp.]